MGDEQPVNSTSHWKKARVVRTYASVINAFQKAAEEATIEERFATKLCRVLQNMELYRKEKALVKICFSECHVMISGPPRVGKSTLINALCDSGDAQISHGLGSCTQAVECHTKTAEHHGRKSITNFWDTVGIETWTQGDIKCYVDDVIKLRHPICLIFCASPGSFVELERLRYLVETCIDSNIFCALVCTNMYFGNRTEAVLQDLNDVLLQLSDSKYSLMSETINSPKPSVPSITYYHNTRTGQRVALTTKINSVEYVDSAKNIRLPPVGVFELIFGIMTSLSEEKVEEMVQMVLDNRPFWTKVYHTCSGFWNERFLKNFRDLFRIK